MARGHLVLAQLSTDDLADLQTSIDGIVCAVFKIDVRRAVLAIEGKMVSVLSSAWRAAVKDGLGDGIDELVKGPYTNERIDTFLKKLGMQLKAIINPARAKTLESRIKAIYALSKQEAARQAKGKFVFGMQDERAIAATNNQQVFWVNKLYSTQLSQRVSAVSKDVLLERGLGHREAGGALMRALRQDLGLAPGAAPSEFAPLVPARYAGNPQYYFQQVASVAGHQARTFGRMRGFQDCGVVTFELVNPMDERTGKVCTEMHGQVFTVDAGIKQMDAIVAAKDPNAVKAVAPWVPAKDIHSALGGAKAGSPEATGKLLGLNVTLPPFHPLCRTEPVILSTGAPQPAAPPQPKPVRPPKPRPPKPPPPPPNPQLAQLERERAKLEGYSGAATPGDGGMVENQDVRWRVEQWEGKDYVVVRFKVTPQSGPGVEAAMRSMGAVEGKQAPFRAAVIDPKTGAVRHTGDLGNMRFGGLRVREAGRQVVLVTQNGAMKNLLEIRIPGTDVKKAQAALEEVAKKLGISNPAAVPTAAEVRALQQARIITQWDREAWAELQRISGPVTPDKVDEIFKRAVKRNPSLRSILDDMKQTEVASGHVAQYSPVQAKAIQEAGVRHLYHDISDPDRVPLLLEKDPARSGLLSSLQRYERGVFTNGMSTARDFETGGADSVFTRLATQPDRGRHGCRIIIDPKVLGRSDWYAFEGDRYGAAGPAQYPSRMLGKDIQGHARKGGFGSSNEVMFQHGIPVSDMKGIVISDERHRAAVIKRLREKGIEQVNGKKLEDFIVNDASKIK